MEMTRQDPEAPAVASGRASKTMTPYVALSGSLSWTQQTEASTVASPPPKPQTFMGVENKLFVQTCYMAIFAMLGSWFRILLAQLFGEECANPGSVGWLASGSPLCVTKDGEGQQQGGIVFADLPANLIGSFIMGAMQSTSTLGLPGQTAVAWTTPANWFQSYDIVHLAITTGMCGSLTTFSSWNSEMVVMIFGTGANHQSRVFRALFGYIVGMETALGSYVFGKTLARWMYKYWNPIMDQEAHAMIDAKERGMYINENLPDFERRFLHEFDSSMDFVGSVVELERQAALDKWRSSVVHARRVGHPDLNLLIEIENTMLAKREPLLHRSEAVAQTKNWEIAALCEYAGGMPPPSPEPAMNNHLLFKPVPALILCAVVHMSLVGLLVFLNGASAYTVTNRTMVYAVLLAGPGAILRWHLSQYNGKLGGLWSWFPRGTFTANMVGAIISMSMVAAEYISPARSFWPIATMRAVKIGFAGSLTTVSTFVKEINAFHKNARTTERAYIYMATTLATAAILGLITYTVVVYGFGQGQGRR